MNARTGVVFLISVAILFLLFSILSGCSAGAQSSTVTLTWTAPTAFTDGTPIAPAVITYNAYQGAKGAETKAGTAASTTFVATAVPGTTQCWYVTAVVAGIESVPSAEVCSTFAPRQPNPPTNLSTGAAAAAKAAAVKRP